MTITWRFTLSAVAAILLTAVVLALAVDLSIRKSLTRTELDLQKAAAERIAADLASEVRGVRQDVVAVMGATPVAEVLSATQAGQPPPSAARAATLRTFEAEMAAKPQYIQMRVIGAAGGGREVIRVDRDLLGGFVRVVSDDDLQPKGERRYFKASLAEPAGQVYVSPIELNREHGKVQVPYVPVLRAGAPVFAGRAKPAGIVIINVDMRRILERLHSGGGGARTYLVDAAGRYLVNPDRAREFAHEFGVAGGLAQDFPALADLPAATTPLAREIAGPGGQRLTVAAAPVELEGEVRVVAITMAPSGRAVAAQGARTATLLAAIGAAVIGAMIAAFLAQGLSRPIVEITRAARDFTETGEMVLPARRTGEAGVLADTLEHMQTVIGQRNAALERDEQRLRQVIDASPSAMLMVDPDGTIQLANARADQIFGYPRAQLIGRKVETLVPLASRAQHPAFLKAFFLRPEARPMGDGRDLFARRQDGSEIPVEIGLTPIETPEGRFVLAAIVDLTVRKAAEALQNRLVAIVESSQDAIVGKTLDGVITSWNGAAEQLFGFSAKQMVGRKMNAVIPKRLLKEERSLLARVGRGETVEPFETVRRCSDGREVDVSVTLSPVRDSKGAVVGASSISRDITERKRQADELRRSNASLEQFAYVASHDLQEPLRMVANFTDLLAQRYQGQLDDKADRYLAYASEGAHRMQRLVADLLAYSRVGSQGKPLAPTSSQAIVDAVIRSLGPAIREADAVVEHGPLPYVMADEVQLGQLFQNLIGNALKFRSEAAPHVRIEAERDDRLWVFRVADNGIGMDVSHAERIFQMFQRLHERGRYEGSGIGLAIAKQIVERHGGTIRVESEPGAGSTFIFTLRAVPETEI